MQKGDTQRNLVADGSVVGRKQGSGARSSYSRSSRIPHSSRRGISDGAGSSEETIIQARGEQARALAEAKVKAQAAQAEQQHIREVQEKQLAIKRRGIDLQLEGRRKEDETRAEQELLALEDEQLQVQSETWMRDQRDIQETLAAEAGAGAEAEGGLCARSATAVRRGGPWAEPCEAAGRLKARPFRNRARKGT